MKRLPATLLIGLIISSTSQGKEISLLDLSIEELLAIDLSGDSVRQMDLNQITSTANPFEQPIIRLPYSVDVITAESIAAKGIKNVIQAAETMTGILSGESPSEPYSFSTRGFSRDSIDVTYDGISMGLSTLNMRPQSTFNIAKMEVLRGPASLNNGQGAAGATINIVTKKAKMVEHHTREALVSIGEYGKRSINIGFTGPISPTLAYRLDMSRNQDDGWVEDTKSDTNNISSSLIWQAQDDLSVLFSLIYLDDELPAYWGTPFVPSDLVDDAIDSVLSDNTELTIDKKTRFINYNVSDHQISSTSLWQRVDMNWQLNNDVKLNANLFRFTADRDWKNSESYFFNPQLSRVERDRLLVAHDRNNWGTNANLTYSHNLAGRSSSSNIKLEYIEMELNRDVGFNLASPSLYWDDVDLYNPVSATFGYVDKRYDKTQTMVSALVLNNLTDITKNTQLHTNLRYEHIDYNRHYINWDGSVRDRATGNNEYNELSYLLGISHALSNTSSVYGHYSFAHDPIFAEHRVTYNINALEPSDIRQIELGYKAEVFDGNTDLAVAIYDIKKTTVTQVDEITPLFDSVRLATGLDLGFNSELSENLLIGGHLAYVNARYKRYYDPELGEDVSNNTPMNTPELMANFKFSYLLESSPIELGGGINYVSSRWRSGLNTVELAPYTYQNIYVSYNGNNYHVALHINNLSDEVYGPWSDLYYPNQIIIAPPRLVELSYRVNF